MNKSIIIFSECNTNSEEIIKEDDLDKLNHYVDVLKVVQINLNTKLNDFINSKRGEIGPKYAHYATFRNMLHKKNLYKRLRGIVNKRIGRVKIKEKKERIRKHEEEKRKIREFKKIKEEKRLALNKTFERTFIEKVKEDFPSAYEVAKEYAYNKLLAEKEKVA